MAVRSARVRAYAKINLGLKVLYKRPDNYHEVRTILQTIGLHDTLQIEVAPARATQLTLSANIDIADNLVLRAARLVLDRARLNARIHIHLDKKIPMGAGLGGGSTDAAAVLVALPVLLRKPMSMDDLAGMGAQLGSDVPFFLHGGTALGIGRGEELYPQPEPPSLPVLIVAPPVHVSTAEAYSGLGRLTSAQESPKLVIFQSFAWRESGVSAAENDFESAVFRSHPELGRWLKRLESSGACLARMSGSGSSLFGIYLTREELRKALPRFPANQVQVFETRLVTRRQYRAVWWRSLQEHISGVTWPPRSR